MNISLIRWVFIVLGVLVFAGCANNGRFVQGPDGNSYYELPRMRNHEEHCHGAGVFSKRIAQWRFRKELREGKEFIIPNSKESARKDLDDDLKGIVMFAEEKERNLKKINELFDRT